MSERAAGYIHGYLITLRQDPFSASTVWGIKLKGKAQHKSDSLGVADFHTFQGVADKRLGAIKVQKAHRTEPSRGLPDQSVFTMVHGVKSHFPKAMPRSELASTAPPRAARRDGTSGHAVGIAALAHLGDAHLANRGAGGGA